MPAGFEGRAGYVREATTFSRIYPSATAAAVTTALPFVSEDVNLQLDQQSLVTRQSLSVPTIAKVIRGSVSGNAVINADYEGLEFLFAAALGHQANRINGILQPEELTAGLSYRHIIEVDRDIRSDAWVAGDGFIAGAMPTGDGLIANQQKMRRGTWAISKGISVWETLSAMVDTLTVQVSPSGVTLQVNFLGHSINYNSTINAAIETLQCAINKVLFKECKLFFRLAGTGSFDPTDELTGMTGFSVQMSNNLQALNTRDTGTSIDEPQRGPAFVVSGGFALPRFFNQSVLTANANNTPVRLKLECTGGIIPGTTESFQMNLWLPVVNLSGGSVPTTGPTQLQQNYSFIALGSSQAPGFPDTTKAGPVIVELVNTNPEHALLD